MTEVSFTLYKSELIYDFENKAFLTGRSRKDVASVEAVASMQGSDSDDDRNQALRSIQNAYGVLLVTLGEYLKTEEATEEGGDNELMDSTTDFTFTLKLPSNYNRAGDKAIASAAHKFIVNSALADWFLITNKPDAPDYAAMAASNMVDLRSALNRRTCPTRPAVVKQ